MNKTTARIVIALLSLLLPATQCTPQGIDWICDYDRAVETASIRGDLLLLDFVGTWDPIHEELNDPRTMMEDYVWRDTAIIRMAGQFVCVRLKCYYTVATPNQLTRYEQLLTRHRVTAVPVVVIADLLGMEFARIVGYQSKEHMATILGIPIPDLFHPYRALEGLRTNPGDAALAIAAGEAYFDAGLHGLSNQYLERAMDSDTLERDAVLREHVEYNLALNHERMNDTKEAAAMMERLLDDYPGSANRPAYLLWLVRLHLRGTETSRAREYLRILEKEYPGSEQARVAREIIRD